LSESATPALSSARRASENGCNLCGLPLGKSRVAEKIGGNTLRFCCPGCRQVFLLLFNRPGGLPENFRETSLYRACLESGLIPRNETDLARREETISAVATNPDSTPSLDLPLRIEGMWCPACAWVINEVLRKERGVLEAKVFFLSDSARIKYLPHAIRPEEIMARVSSLGYRAIPFHEAEGVSREKRDLLKRLGISAILTAHLMMLSFALYFGFFQEFSSEAVQYLSYPLCLMATPVLFYGGLPILKRGLTAFRHGAPSMDTLISIGSLAAYFYSLFQMVQGSLHLYFDTASMLITIVLLGRYIESQARERVSGGINDLYHLAHQKVRLVTQNSATSAPVLPRSPGRAGEAPLPAQDSPPLTGGRAARERWVSSEAVLPGDVFSVLTGEIVPLDGKVIGGRGVLDESMLTGEARPVKKGEGDEVMAGSLLSDGKLMVQTTRVGAESSLGQMISLMQTALAGKNPAELLADRITRRFVPAILLIAGVTCLTLWWVQYPAEDILIRGLTVLVISCPCALGIAIPIVKVVVLGLARSKGLLVRDPVALEKAKDLDTLVFDKTGTLTEGRYSLHQVVTQDGLGEDHVLSLLAAVEAHSDHFLAREVLRKVGEKGITFAPAKGFENLDGTGVRGEVQGRQVFLGNRLLLKERGFNLCARWDEKAKAEESKGKTVVFFAWEKEVRGFLVFGDSLRRGVAEMVQSIQSRGINVWVVSGDSRETTRSIAFQAGIAHFRGLALPQDKAKLIQSLQAEGHRVGMIGDGINDGAALAQADVGFACGAGSNILREASDITFLAPDPGRVLEAIDLSHRAVRTIRQNLFFAFLYNSAGIPLAIAGWLNPLIAVFAMFASSLTVIGNALRVPRAKGV
jgi:heavy metal translocating P-type ATPase